MGALRPSEAPAPIKRPNYLARPAEPRPVTATRYPRLYKGEQAAANLVVETLKRRGTAQVEMAEDLEVSPNLVSEWCKNEKPVRLGAILALQNKRLARAILNAALDHLDNVSPRHE